jgi:DHA3 family macrolide efflux protein-like MFS transporter
LLVFTSQLQVWYIYLAIFLNSVFNSIHSPALNASITLLVPKEHLGRANGVINTGDSIGQLIGPTLAGLLMVQFGLGSLLLIDLVTCFIAILMLLAVQIPKPETTLAGKARKGPLLRAALYGMTYVKTRAGLMILFVFQNTQFLLVQMGRVLLTPLILDLTTADVLGMITSVSAIGGIAGGLVMSVWGGPKRRVHGAVGSAFLIGAGIALAGLQPSVILIGASMAFVLFISPIQMSSRQALWQSKVAPEAQGRVFAFHQLGRAFVLAISYSVAGPLADTVFEPLLAPGGSLAGSIGQIIGVGPGRGVGLFYICLGTLLILATVGAYLYPRLRLIEDEVPDAV